MKTFSHQHVVDVGYKYKHKLVKYFITISEIYSCNKVCPNTNCLLTKVNFRTSDNEMIKDMCLSEDLFKQLEDGYEPPTYEEI